MSLDLHVMTPSTVGTWTEALAAWPVVLAVPKGLEGSCAGIARRESRLRLKMLHPGLVRTEKSEVARLPDLLRNAPIWSFGAFIVAGRVAVGDVFGEGLAQAEKAIAAVAEAFGLAGEAYWLNCPKEETDAARRLAARLLASHTLPLRNDPTDYRLTLRLMTVEGDILLLLGPSISVKERFPYRQDDAGPSINPVLAAAMVRLAPPADGGIAIDPTCGSGTLLAERLAFSSEAEARGIDIGAQARAAFAANLQQGATAGYFNFQAGDGADPAHWAPCRTVLSNLPFGIRVRQPREELEALYFGVLANAARFLEPGGRAIVTSSSKRLLDDAFLRERDRLPVLARYKAEMGGLVYQIVVAAKS
ncbi:methyltransferase [Xanthobacteraceae bacterium A53D]